MTTAFTGKKPSEAFSVSFDFTAVLGSETISSATITATDLYNLTDATATILDATKQTNTDEIVYAAVQGGTSGHNYLIRCQVTGSAGSTFILDGVLPVEETDSSISEAGTGETLTSLIDAIQAVIQDSAYDEPALTKYINSAISSIAGGIRMPDGTVTPPLPDLYTSGVVPTTTAAYAVLPSNYQRNIFKIVDSSGNIISPPGGGDYYAFNLFLKRVSNLNLTETGSVYQVCVKGRKLYYQGIPSAAENIGIHYYKKPTPLAEGTDEPDCLPEHLQMRLIKHWVCKEIFGEQIEDGQDNTGIGTRYHTSKFYEAMTDLIDYIGIDSGPIYYDCDDNTDTGICDG